MSPVMNPVLKHSFLLAGEKSKVFTICRNKVQICFEYYALKKTKNVCVFRSGDVPV